MYEMQIQAIFELEKNRLPGPLTIFKFDPGTGTIPVDGLQKIRVTLFCNERGRFEEHFRWNIKDSVNYAPILFRGVVGNPAIIVEPSALNFGLVSYGFDCFREFRITNNGNIPLHFTLKLDELEVYMICPIYGPMKRIKVPYDCTQHGFESFFSITPALQVVPSKVALSPLSELIQRTIASQQEP
jgi:hypothetical protein